MAVEITKAPVGYKGLSTDIKPTTASVKSTFYERDTNTLYEFDGDSWNVIGVSGAASVTLPQNASGILSVDELQSLTIAAPIVRFFPNGLTGLKMWFDQIGGLSASKYCAVAFNNTAFNDVNVVGLRRLVRIGDEQVFTFKDNGAGTLPTEVTFLSSDSEVALGDTAVYFEAVQKL